jgi:hypothetical protein
MARASSEKMTKQASPIREALREFVKTHVSTLDDRKQLANYMGTSVHYVHSMLYRGEGGLDAWINALLFCLRISPDGLISLWKERGREEPKLTSTEADRIWFGLDKKLKASQKLWWARILRAAVMESRRLQGRIRVQ